MAGNVEARLQCLQFYGANLYNRRDRAFCSLIMGRTLAELTQEQVEMVEEIYEDNKICMQAIQEKVNGLRGTPMGDLLLNLGDKTLPFLESPFEGKND